MSEAADQDLYRLFEITSLAFGHTEPFWDASWPQHWTETGRKAGASRFKNLKVADSTNRFIKAIDKSSGEIIGMAKWNIYYNHTPNFSEVHGKGEDYWDSEEQREWHDYPADQFYAERRDAMVMSNGNIVCLDVLAVNSIHQRQGVGSALVQWGTNQADKLCLFAVVESSVAGKGLYEKFGLVCTKQVQLKVPSKWLHLGGRDYAWMVRPESAKQCQTPAVVQ